jgi:hypothetical protein
MVCGGRWLPVAVCGFLTEGGQGWEEAGVKVIAFTLNFFGFQNVLQESY